MNPQQPDQKKLILNAFETLVKAEAEGALDAEFKAQVIWEAHEYARKNKLPYDGTFKGAMKLLEQANKMVQDHHALQEKALREEIERRRRQAGFRGTDRVKDLIQ